MKKPSTRLPQINQETPQSPSENRGLSRGNPNSLPCPDCGSQQKKLGVGKGPHSASLLCECGRFVKWISKNELVALAAQLNQGGQV